MRITQDRPTSWPAPSGVISTKLEGSSEMGTSTVPRFLEAIAAQLSGARALRAPLSGRGCASVLMGRRVVVLVHSAAPPAQP